MPFRASSICSSPIGQMSDVGGGCCSTDVIRRMHIVVPGQAGNMRSSSHYDPSAVRDCSKPYAGTA